MGSNSNRSKAGSVTLQRPDSPLDDPTNGGNVQLMEARLLELYSSLRALERSNQELKEALSTTNPNDKDFIQAIEENWSTMRKQRELAIDLVTSMKRQAVNIDLPKDICDLDIPAHVVPFSVTETGVYL
uniref:Uncharacterized protein n=1 Tax=Attheya septentrionalis TaxID=420275 RepID=A0A7S2UNV0_9STRA|mmetsp:Transcript_3213/g.5836  ORF Transcript_3213/g.5836 Transcript_3213/m.5836 type:complete len:129 (+) Transcript_3213:1-387(+)